MPYYIDENEFLSPEHIKIARHGIAVATAEIHDMVLKHGGVNITFEERLKLTRTNMLHIFGNDTTSCWAHVGFVKDTPHQMNLGSCYNSEAAIKHEFLHILGLWHEQQHPFADRYITMNCIETNSCDGNCEPKGDYAYQTTPYDPTSIMHYQTVFCGKMSMTPTGNALLSDLNMTMKDIGNFENVSVHDAEMAAIEYSEEHIRESICEDETLIRDCTDSNKCIHRSYIGNGICHKGLECYFWDGGDCIKNTQPPVRQTSIEPQFFVLQSAAHSAHATFTFILFCFASLVY